MQSFSIPIPLKSFLCDPFNNMIWQLLRMWFWSGAFCWYWRISDFFCFSKPLHYRCMVETEISPNLSCAPSSVYEPSSFSSDSRHVFVCCIHMHHIIWSSGAKLLRLYGILDKFRGSAIIYTCIVLLVHGLGPSFDVTDGPRSDWPKQLKSKRRIITLIMRPPVPGGTAEMARLCPEEFVKIVTPKEKRPGKRCYPRWEKMYQRQQVNTQMVSPKTEGHHNL